MKSLPKMKVAFASLVFAAVASPSIAATSLTCSGDMAPYITPASSYYVGDYMTLAVQSIPGGTAKFSYQYGSGPLIFVRYAGNKINVPVQTVTPGWQNLRAATIDPFAECILSAFVYSVPTATINSITGNLYTVSTITFNGSVSGGAGGNTYLWTFGDGETSTDQNATHSYNGSGTYQVSLKATDQNNRESVVATQSITIVDNPNVPGTPSGLNSQFLGCNGYRIGNYQISWWPTGAQPTNYFAYEFKPYGTSAWLPVQWLTTTNKTEGVNGGGSNGVKVRGCTSASESTCGPSTQITFNSSTCLGGGGDPL